MKKKIGILDEVAYSYELMQKLNQEASEEFFAYSFSEKSSLKQQMNQVNFDVLIVGEEFYEHNLKELAVPCLIVLTEQKNVSFNCEGIHTIYKYQAFHKLLKEMKKCWTAGFYKEQSVEGETRFIGIYSPVRRCGKTTFALLLAKQIAEFQDVLYLNLEPYCSNLMNSEEPPEWNLADILYFLKEKKENDLFSKAIFDFQGIKAIYPMNSPLDLQEISQEDWSDFFYLLSQQPIKCVIVDFDESTRCFWKILERCSQIYMPVLEEEASKQKAAAFFNVLEMASEKEIRDKIKQLSFPVLQHTNMELLNEVTQKLLGEMNGESK